MKRTALVALTAALGLAATSGTAFGAGVAYTDADWSQATITSGDGTKLHADVLRPKGYGLDDKNKTPVIVSIGPYFNRAGQEGPYEDITDTSAWDPVGPSAGPSSRFKDFVDGAKLFTRTNGPKYTFVMVDLRGFGGSGGCLDWGGPGEQGDVAAAIEWAATQPWSDGNVGTYGKSYDGETGLIATALQPKGLKAVVAQEPVYDDYRYLYGDGIRRLNSVLTPALYDEISLTPGPAGDTASDPMYTPGGVQENAARPGCHALNFAEQAGNDDHYSPFWRQRNLISEVKGSQVPLFLTQGLTENNTAPDGTAEFLANHKGPERAWMGPWNHVRGNELDGTKLAMGRKGWFDEIMSFYDQYLEGIAPSTSYPPFAIQSETTGRWRAELQWPPADATSYTSDLAAGTYTDTAQSSRTSNTGVWTVSKPLPYDVHTAGAGVATIDVSTTVPRANLVVDVYDLDASGKGPLVAKNGSLIRDNGAVRIPLMSADWVFRKGHRIGVRVTDNNSDWWLAAVPTEATVTVYGGSLTLPFLQYARTQTVQGDSGTTRSSWLSTTSTAPATAVTGAVDFNLPPALAPEPDDMKAALDALQGS